MFEERNKFQYLDKVKVNRRAAGRSWFLFKEGTVVDYGKKCYGVEFKLPGSGRIEYRRLQAYHLTKAR